MRRVQPAKAVPVPEARTTRRTRSLPTRSHRIELPRNSRVRTPARRGIPEVRVQKKAKVSRPSVAAPAVVRETRKVTRSPSVVIKRPTGQLRENRVLSKVLRHPKGSKAREVREVRRIDKRGLIERKFKLINNKTTDINNNAGNLPDDTIVAEPEPADTGSNASGARHRQHRSHDRRGGSLDLDFDGHNFRQRHKLRHKYHYGVSHTYDRHPSSYHNRRIFHHLVRPSYRQAICYGYGPSWTFRWVYPYYHRRYVFVSLGGYWPAGYNYMRYYWYGCHPYYWYGYEPVAYPIGGDTHNYYTYNYYYDDADLRAGEVVNGIQVPDYDALSAVREALEKQAAEEPDEETEADRYFDEAIKAFENGDYAMAVMKFHDALEHEPDDIVLPFAYVQALFADDQYAEAAEALRKAVSGMPSEEEGIFYPRGLYLDGDILNGQIERLTQAEQEEPLNSDLQMLLGYQLLGVGRFDEAGEYLHKAQTDLDNQQAATLLLELWEKLKDAEQKQEQPSEV